MRFQRRADTVPHVRGLVGRELSRHGADAEVVNRLVLASAEACNNAIMHSASTTYLVTVDIQLDMCTITVSDEGHGFDVPDRPSMPEPDAVGNRGLALMGALVEDVKVSSSVAGTTVVLRHKLSSNGQGRFTPR